MEIKVLSRSAKRRDFILAVSTFFVQALKLKKSKFKIYVYPISGYFKEFDAYGSVMLAMPGRLNMYLDSALDPIKIVEVLSHEFIHVKQHARGQLKQYIRRDGEHGWKWMGKINNAKYESQPWEIEARKREKKLGNKIIDIINAG